MTNKLFQAMTLTLITSIAHPQLASAARPPEAAPGAQSRSGLRFATYVGYAVTDNNKKILCTQNNESNCSRETIAEVRGLNLKSKAASYTGGQKVALGAPALWTVLYVAGVASGAYSCFTAGEQSAKTAEDRALANNLIGPKDYVDSTARALGGAGSIMFYATLTAAISKSLSKSLALGVATSAILCPVAMKGGKISWALFTESKENIQSEERRPARRSGSMKSIKLRDEP